MPDPQEGLTPDGMIRTGATPLAIDPAYDPVLRATVAAVAGRGSLYVYGSVANGTAVTPVSDVDLLSIGLPPDEAASVAADLSARFRDRCREVSIGPARWENLQADSDEGHGFRVFLRHYCVHLDGADPARDLPAYPGDVRAARGFNGDIADHVARWEAELEDGRNVPRLATRIARKTLLAVAGLVSVRDATWTTDRRVCAARWNDLEPGAPVDALVTWLDTPPRDPGAVRRALAGPVASIVQAFEAEIGLWRE